METNKNIKKSWNKPEIKNHLPIRETLGNSNAGTSDTNPAGNRPRS